MKKYTFVAVAENEFADPKKIETEFEAEVDEELIDSFRKYLNNEEELIEEEYVDRTYDFIEYLDDMAEEALNEYLQSIDNPDDLMTIRDVYEVYVEWPDFE